MMAFVNNQLKAKMHSQGFLSNSGPEQFLSPFLSPNPAPSSEDAVLYILQSYNKNATEGFRASHNTKSALLL